MARRDDREYREYLSEEQRSQRGCIARRMQPDFRHGLLGFEGGFCATLCRTARNSLILNGEMSEWSIEHAWK